MPACQKCGAMLWHGCESCYECGTPTPRGDKTLTVITEAVALTRSGRAPSALALLEEFAASE